MSITCAMESALNDYLNNFYECECKNDERCEENECIDGECNCECICEELAEQREYDRGEMLAENEEQYWRDYNEN